MPIGPGEQEVAIIPDILDIYVSVANISKKTQGPVILIIFLGVHWHAAVHGVSKSWT